MFMREISVTIPEIILVEGTASGRSFLAASIYWMESELAHLFGLVPQIPQLMSVSS
jgi:hypothetical protein